MPHEDEEVDFKGNLNTMRTTFIGHVLSLQVAAYLSLFQAVLWLHDFMWELMFTLLLGQDCFQNWGPLHDLQEKTIDYIHVPLSCLNPSGDHNHVIHV